MFSEATLSGCYKHRTAGTYFWTARQRIDPSRESTFVWRVKSTDTCCDTVSVMKYTNWYTGQPDNSGGSQACMAIWSDLSYTWDDTGCSTKFCSVCAVDSRVGYRWVKLVRHYGFSARNSCASALYAIANPSVRTSHGWISQKRLKLESCNFHRTVAPFLLFLRDKFHPEILTGSPKAGASNKGRLSKTRHFLALCVNISFHSLDGSLASAKWGCFVIALLQNA